MGGQNLPKQFLPIALDDKPYQIAYWSVGSGQPIVFLHGFMGRSDYWEPMVSLLQSDYRCICLDLLGCGDSSKPMIRYDIATLVAATEQAIAALNLGAFVLVGHSLGGWVASGYVLAQDVLAQDVLAQDVLAQDAVKNLILLAPAGIRDDSFCGRYDWLRPLFWRTPAVDLALFLARPIAFILNKTANLERIREFRHELNAQPAPRSFLLDRLRPEDAIDTVEKDIHRIKIPTLVITGDRDETIPLWHSETYANQIPNAQLAIISEADHSLPQGYTKETVALMRSFLQTE